MKQLTRLLFLLALPLFSHAQLNCEIKVTKADCWKNYDVIVTLQSNIGSDHNTTYNKRVVYLTREQKQKKSVYTNTVSLPCKKGGAVMYYSTFKPTVWDDEKEGEKYYAIQSLFVLNDISDRVEKIAMEVCFPNDFKNVPFPYEYSPSCACKDYSTQSEEKK